MNGDDGLNAELETAKGNRKYGLYRQRLQSGRTALEMSRTSKRCYIQQAAD